MSKVAEKIKALSNQVASEKLAEEQAKAEQRVAADIKIIEDILTLVKDRLIYKESEKAHSRRKTFLVVTEDIVLHDYSNPPEHGSGTSITWQDGSYYSYPHTTIKVNGHRYYHAADLITRYKHDAAEAMKRSEQEYEAAKKRKQAIEDLEDLEGVMKELMLNYQKTLGKYKLEAA